MNSVQVQLSGQEILEKEFKTAIRGYNQEEVDEFLDTVIQDYETYQKKIEKLENEINQLKKNANHSRTRAAQPTQQVNYDILKRLSNLEKEVFGRRVVES